MWTDRMSALGQKLTSRRPIELVRLVPKRTSRFHTSSIMSTVAVRIDGQAKVCTA